MGKFPVLAGIVFWVSFFWGEDKDRKWWHVSLCCDMSPLCRDICDMSPWKDEDKTGHWRHVVTCLETFPVPAKVCIVWGVCVQQTPFSTTVTTVVFIAVVGIVDITFISLVAVWAANVEGRCSSSFFFKTNKTCPNEAQETFKGNLAICMWISGPMRRFDVALTKMWYRRD